MTPVGLREKDEWRDQQLGFLPVLVFQVRAGLRATPGRSSINGKLSGLDARTVAQNQSARRYNLQQCGSTTAVRR